jgi:beta-glucosidase
MQSTSRVWKDIPAMDIHHRYIRHVSPTLSTSMKLLTRTANTTGTGDWSNAIAQARALVAQMTLAKKENVTMGFTNAKFNGCNGKSVGVPRLGFPGYCLNNAENGVGGAEGVNAYPAALHMGASRNRELAYARGMQMGREFRRKGVNVALGRSLGPLGRSPKGGRYGVDWTTHCEYYSL